MDIFNEFASDENLEVNGKEVSLDKDTKVVVARLNNPNHVKLLLSTVEQYKDQLDTDPDLDDVLTVEVLAKTILRGWSGVTYKGAELPYSIKNAKLLLAHKDFRKKIVQIASDFNNYRAKLDKGDVKK